MNNKKVVVTGAFSYSGKYISERLKSKGYSIRTFTNKRSHASQDSEIEVFPYRFDDENELVKSLEGVGIVINTYWVRFDYADRSYGQAVENTRKMIKAACKAGVKRFVHVSITNPSEESPLLYFHGKAVLEKELADSGLSYAVLRPTVLFGKEDILVNNIAWMLRRFPVFGIFGDGSYGIQPVFVGDLAALAVELAENDKNIVIDAVGPERFTYREFVSEINKRMGTKRFIVNIPPALGLVVGRVLGSILGDVVITPDEIRGLMAGLLVSHEAPTCPTKLTSWLSENADYLGRRYASEIARHYGRIR